MPGPIIVAAHFHAGCRLAAAGRGEHTLAFDFDHTRAAVAVGPHALLVAKARDLDTVAPRRLQDRLVTARRDVAAVQLELHGHRVELAWSESSHDQIFRERAGTLLLRGCIDFLGEVFHHTAYRIGCGL